MNVLAREGGTDAVNVVRSRWDCLQKELMLSAYEIAEKARQQIDEGNDKQAELMLTKYVKQNVSTMLIIVEELTASLELEV